MENVLRKLGLAFMLSACAAPAASAVPRAPVPPASARATPIPAPDWTGEEGNFLIDPAGIWGSGELVITAGSRGVMRSEDRGKTWEYIGIDLNESVVWGAAEDDIYIAAHDLYRSRDRGKTWKKTALGTSDRPITTVWGTSGEDVWISGGSALLAHSRDHGLSFQSVKTGLPPDAVVEDIAGRDDEVWISASELGDHPDEATKPLKSLLLRTKNHGKKWTRASAPPSSAAGSTQPLRNLCFTESGAIWASLGHQVWVSRDDAKTWTASVAQDLTGTPAEVLSLACRGRTIVAAGKYRQARISRDDGATWTENEFDSLIETAPQLKATWIQPTGELFVGANADRSTMTMFRFGL